MMVVWNKARTRSSMKNNDVNKMVLNRGDGWIILDKPAGYESIVRGGGNTKYCFTSIARRSLGLNYLAPCHRLDRDTSGCLLMSTDKDLTKSLEASFRDKTVSKSYLGITRGAPKAATGVVNHPLSRWEGGHKPVRVIKGRQGQPAETSYEVLMAGEGENRTGLIRFTPVTGRTHQIRVHAAALGHPIIGDDQYGDRSLNSEVKLATGLDRQALHAWRISLSVPGDKGTIRATAFLPEDMAVVLNQYLPQWQAILKKS